MIHLDLLTPEKKILSSDVHRLLVPQQEGMIQILPHHVPYIGKLTQGMIHVFINDQEQTYPVQAGFIFIERNKTTLLITA